ncbi:hypothetical protein FGW37_11000 [Streptomyces rectiverticillatus]|uniref:hypothetical protein n=1 Tax=Streptomyces rectiverticillatus TaxID=173860 RepID=UPI0015C3CA4D|nr:hypothetical protein [Streptomyces rectiverticillatus]QLE72062.1 hypothetical protein FGW37_11000 [Streptomyces rectiverticillatus]
MNGSQPRGRGKAIGIGVGVLAVLGSLVGGGLYMVSGNDDKAGTYTIELPQTLADGEYKQLPGKKEKQGPDADDRAELKKLGLGDADGDNAVYRNDKKQGLQVIGVYGRIPDPEKAVDKMIKEMSKAGEDDAEQPPGDELKRGKYQDYRPGGFDGAVLKCKQDAMSFSMDGTRISMTTSQCIWGDKGAVGLVASHSMGGSDDDGRKADGLPADKLAELTAKIRNEVRKPK